MGQENTQTNKWKQITTKENQLDGVYHACNPSYLRGRDQEDHGLNPPLEKCLQNFI
jgi:hypothetical protein